MIESDALVRPSGLATNDALETELAGLEFVQHVMKAAASKEHQSIIKSMNPSDRAYLAFLKLSCEMVDRLPTLYERVARFKDLD